MKDKKTTELAALHALGALDGADAAAFADLLAQGRDAAAEAKAFGAVAEALAKTLPPATPSPGLRESILAKVQLRQAKAKAEAGIKALVPASQDGLGFLREAAGGNWLPLPVAGAFVKLLSFDATTDYAVVLGKLEAGSRYPAHTHKCAEDIYMLSGDLHVGEHVIRAGDFHHAEAGSRHGVNWSERGCVLLCVLSKEDLLAQIARE